MTATVAEDTPDNPAPTVSTADATTPPPPPAGTEAGIEPVEVGQDVLAAGGDGLVDARRVRLFRGPFGVLRCTLEGEKSVLRAKVVRAFPLTDGDRWFNVLDAKNKEVCLIERLDDLDAESRRLAREELERHYRTIEVRRIRAIKSEYRTMYWDVDTDRGRREFVMKWSSDTILWLSGRRLMLVDIDTNRFLIPDVTLIDAHSRQQLEIIV